MPSIKHSMALKIFKQPRKSQQATYSRRRFERNKRDRQHFAKLKRRKLYWWMVLTPTGWPMWRQTAKEKIPEGAHVITGQHDVDTRNYRRYREASNAEG